MPEIDPSDQKTLDERPWYRNVKAVIALAGGTTALVLGIVAIIGLVEGWFDSDGPSGLADNNMMLVIDRSEAMGRSFDGTTKLEAAVNAASETLKAVPKTAGVGLRQFGGECEAGEGETELLVPLAIGNKDKVESALRDIEADGQSTLAAGVVEATGDFSAADTPPRPNALKRIVVITAGADTCFADPEDTINDAISNRSDLLIDFRFIGLDLSSDELRQIDEIAAATGSDAGPLPVVINVQSAADLECALEGVTNVEPGIVDTLTLAEILNNGIEDLDDVVTLVGTGDFEATSSKLGEARSQWELSGLPLDMLAARRDDEDFDQLFELGQANRETQTAMQDAAESLIDFAAVGDFDGVEAARLEYNSLVSDHRGTASDMQEIINKLADSFDECA